jgi:hypothetical protein
METRADTFWQDRAIEVFCAVRKFVSSTMRAGDFMGQCSLLPWSDTASLSDAFVESFDVVQT